MGLFGKKDKLQIIAFQSYGTESHLYIRGRALEDEEIDLESKGWLSLLQNTWKRFKTDEIKHAPIIVTLPDKRTVQGKTDKDGYYLIDEPDEGLAALTNEEGWLIFEIAYADAALKRDILNQNRFPGEMLIPSNNADFGVISDIDDTILHTGVVSSLKWQVIVNTVFKNVFKREPLEGTAEFYHLLHRGDTGEKANPIFYVSHSPWNLYRYLKLFLKTNKFPKGPILLRTLSSFKNRKSEKPQKQKEILNILKTYPQLKCILIGDSGERDADIYIEIAQAMPDRIAAIYLRSVNDEKRMLRVKGLFDSYKTTPVLIVEKTDDAIAHAKENGFIKV